MTSLLTIFSDKENVKSSKKKVSSFPSLNQGKKFKKYQNKIEHSLEKNAEILSGKEGFTNMDIEGKNLTNQTRDIIDKNNYSNHQQIIDNLRQEHEKTLQEYNTLTTQISGELNGYVNRVSPNNPYLNKVVSFTTGEICYVTNQGVVKWIASMDIWKTLNISQKTQVKLNIPWTTDYNTPGTQIPTTPPLVSGTPLASGQSLGNEGSNVFVNQLLPDVKPKYMDCYAANSNNDNMTFIGGSPPSLTDVSIQNGNFSQPQIANNSYQYLTWNTSTVPGWNFDCVLINNSTAWGYPIPYPNGNQCACIQQSQQLWTNIWIPFVAGTTYTLSLSACGRPSDSGINPINIGLEGTTFYTLNPVQGQWQTFTTTFTPQTTGGQRLSLIGTWTSSDRSTAIQNIKLNSGSSDNGTYTYDSCKQAAINNDYRYFALQNVNPSTGQGYCAVSNSEPSIKQYGISKVPNKMIALWSSKTAGQTGNTATLTNTGSLQVINSSGQVVYSTPASSAKPSNYLGCYGDKSTRAMTAYNNGQQLYSNSQCQQIAQQNGYQYYGLQNSTSGTNAQCMLSNNESQSIQYGAATNCTKVSDGSWSGGGWSNALYSTTNPQSNYYLILQNNGNMCIYRGTGPNDNQGGMWCSSTSGKQQSPNPNMVSTNGKYGQNWMADGSTLAPGDFIGSSDGKLALVMQADGNLVLYTYQMENNCQKMSDGNMGGGIGANAAYDIGMNAVSGNIGNLGFIDADSNLYTYPNENQVYSKTYTTFKNLTTDGNDIDGASFGNATVQSCQTACNNNSDCAGFVFDNANKICYPKNQDMYPYGGDSNVLNNVDIHIRGKQPATPPLGVSQNTNNINSIAYQNYVNKGNVGSQYGLANASTTQKQQLGQLQTKLNLLSNQITNLTNNFQVGTNTAEQQSQSNVVGIYDYLTDLNSTNEQSKVVAGETAGNIQNILKDSDVVVLQKNYDYLFWSILAAGTVLVSMNIVKK